MKGRVLLVDEVGVVKIEMSTMLKDYDIEIIHVKDGIELLNYLHIHKNTVRLILWSHISQDYSVFDAIKNLKSKEDYQTIPVAIVSKFADRKYIIKAIESGVSEFIAKPYDQDTVIKKIDKLLGNALLGGTIRDHEDVLMYTFSDMLNREIKAATRGNHPLTIFLCTVTGNNSVQNTNEFYEIIDNIIKVVRAKLRDTDTVFYYGSNNIIILLPFCNKIGSVTVMQKIKYIFYNHSTIKAKNEGLNLIASNVTFPDDGKIKEKLIEKLTKDLISLSAEPS